MSIIVTTGIYALLLKFLQKNSPHNVQTKGGWGWGGGSKAFWTINAIKMLELRVFHWLGVWYNFVFCWHVHETTRRQVLNWKSRPIQQCTLDYQRSQLGFQQIAMDSSLQVRLKNDSFYWWPKQGMSPIMPRPTYVWQFTKNTTIVCIIDWLSLMFMCFVPR